MLIIWVRGFKFHEQPLIWQRAVVQISHDGSPALVLKVFIMNQTFTKGAKFIGNFKHLLEKHKITTSVQVNFLRSVRLTGMMSWQLQNITTRASCVREATVWKTAGIRRDSSTLTWISLSMENVVLGIVGSRSDKIISLLNRNIGFVS